MDAALNRKSLKWGVPGLVTEMVGGFLPILTGQTNPETISLGTVLLSYALMIGGTGMLIVGLGFYAQAKGHSRWAGLLGLLSIIGLIVLACLPDKRKAAKKA